MSLMYQRPPVSDIYSLLRTSNSLIVHFSGIAPGTGNPGERLYYPDDLRNVVTGGAMGGVSCSVISPGDIFGQTENNNNATGCVGVVLGLLSPSSLLDVHAGDGGSTVLPNGQRDANPKSLNLTDLQETITGRHRGTYNEWVVGNYKVLGIFIAAPCMVRAIVDIPAPPGVPANILGNSRGPGICYETINDVQRDFPDQRIFRFNVREIQEVNSSVWVHAPHNTIYF
ncbi:hypothetical protein P0D68_03710 [Paraburkholderia sp. RL17-380-BIE-A]|jgi:hypothetical protein|uniref:hypothetical protein n=1 Tax=Paraburkholderia sp. RL17-380-BIE-A TaxID=3031630 RepID=UPI0038BCD3B4